MNQNAPLRYSRKTFSKRCIGFIIHHSLFIIFLITHHFGGSLDYSALPIVRFGFR